MKKINGYSLIEVVLLISIIIFISTSVCLKFLDGGVDTHRAVDRESNKINKTLFMLSKKSTFNTDETMNDKILTESGFTLVESESAYSPSKFQGEFDNTIHLVTFRF